MSARSLGDFTVTENWQDVTATFADLADAEGFVISKADGQTIFLFFGGAVAPSQDEEGIPLPYRAPVFSTSDHWWVRTNSNIDAKLHVGVAA